MNASKTIHEAWESYKAAVINAGGERETDKVLMHRFMLAFFGGAFVYMSLARRACALSEEEGAEAIDLLDGEIESFNLMIAALSAGGQVPN